MYLIYLIYNISNLYIYIYSMFLSLLGFRLWWHKCGTHVVHLGNCPDEVVRAASNKRYSPLDYKLDIWNWNCFIAKHNLGIIVAICDVNCYPIPAQICHCSTKTGQSLDNYSKTGFRQVKTGFSLRYTSTKHVLESKPVGGYTWWSHETGCLPVTKTSQWWILWSPRNARCKPAVSQGIRYMS